MDTQHNPTMWQSHCSSLHQKMPSALSTASAETSTVPSSSRLKLCLAPKIQKHESVWSRECF